MDSYSNNIKPFYILNSRILTHVIFWISYYVLFSLIWAKDNNYFDSFYLEFILLPIRMAAVYVTLYVFIPNSLLKKKYTKLILQYVLMLMVSGVLQRVFLYFFYENFTEDYSTGLFEITSLFRSMILINTTVLFVSSIKIVQLWHYEHDRNVIQNNNVSNDLIEIKSDKRQHRIHTGDIFFIEGLGNYVVYHTKDKKLISYTSIKEAIDALPNNFMRIHKSYVVNKNRISSYSPESVEVNKTFLPVGRSYRTNLQI